MIGQILSSCAVTAFFEEFVISSLSIFTKKLMVMICY